MRALRWNLMLAGLWLALEGSTAPAEIVFGFLLGWAVLAWVAPATGKRGPLRRVVPALSFFFYFLGQVVIANLRVAREVLTPRPRRRPGILAIPLDASTNTEIMIFANMLTLTPGTLSIDVSEDRRTLYIHAMFVGDPDALRRELKDGLERRLLEVLR